MRVATGEPFPDDRCAANRAASAGSFNDVIAHRHAHPDADLVVLAVEGQTSIGALVVKEGAATTFGTEAFRWQIESALVIESTLRDGALGLPVLERLEDEVETYAGTGLYDGDTPDISDAFDADVLAGIYGSDRQVIWPSK